MARENRQACGTSAKRADAVAPIGRVHYRDWRGSTASVGLDTGTTSNPLRPGSWTIPGSLRSRTGHRRRAARRLIHHGLLYGLIDIAFNAVGDVGILGTPLAEMAYDDFAQLITTVTKAHFLTAKAIATHMMRQGSGVILAISGSGTPTPRMGGCEAAWAALDTMYTQLPAELGPHGIRVAWLRTIGLPESITPSKLSTGTTAEEQCGGTEMTMLKRFPH
jgi:NAD(P)-dependent dehydrogenase (short-subunit alcohol dehydrogenase family)